VRELSQVPGSSDTIDGALLALLCCPTCKGDLVAAPGVLACASPSCGKRFPVVANRPVLIDEARSLFALADYAAPSCPAEGRAGHPPGRVRTWLRRLPSPSINLSATRCFGVMERRLREQSDAPVVLVVGGGIQGKGLKALSSIPSIRLINIDPSQDSAAAVLCDGHDLPFRDATLDGVVVQAVLEHVVDPWRCVEEIHRVLKPEGVVYSEIPFMQQVHMRGYDFTRFTHIGHRRLFRYFDEIESGAVAGPGTALAWSWRYFLSSLTGSRRLGSLLSGIGRVTGFVLELTDHWFKQRPGALDAASCTFFLGTKAQGALCDKEVIAGYRGAQGKVRRTGAPGIARSASRSASRR
jgi:SAM-dependent methyltransferase